MNDSLVAARVDRLPNSRMHREWMFLFAIPLFFDSCDINTFASAAPALIRHWHIAINEIALITSASFIGMFFGASPEPKRWIGQAVGLVSGSEIPLSGMCGRHGVYG